MEVWPLIPQREFTETLEWLTDVIPAKAAEQRISLRPIARQGHGFQYLLDSEQVARARAFCKALGASEFLVPSWEFRRYAGPVSVGAVSVPAETDYAPYAVGDTVVVWGGEDRVESRTVESVSPGSVGFASEPLERGYAAAIVMPARVSVFEQNFEVARRTGPLHRAQVRFLTTQYTDLSAAAATFPQYRGHDVLTDRAVLLSDLTERYAREADRFDGSLGPVWRGPELDYPRQTGLISWSLDDAASLWPIRGWLDTRRGRWKGFWLPSWDVDFVLTATASAAATTLTVRDTGFRLLGVGDVRIELTNGTVLYRQVLSAAAGVSPGTEVLTLASATGTELTVSNVAGISLMTFMRLDADRVEVRHRAARGADIMIPAIEAPVP
jgi:hypothetical protein